MRRIWYAVIDESYWKVWVQPIENATKRAIESWPRVKWAFSTKAQALKMAREILKSREHLIQEQLKDLHL